MNTATHDAHPGNLVRARHREGVVKAADNQHNDGSQLLSIAKAAAGGTTRLLDALATAYWNQKPHQSA